MEITKEARKIAPGKELKLTAKVELVSPEMAHDLLLTNKGNRKISYQHVGWLTRQMENDHWLTTHQGIAIDTNNELQDGQHRLEAIMRSMTSQYMLVVRNVDPATFMVLDSGKPRSAKDALSIEGYESPAAYANGARFSLVYASGKFQANIGNRDLNITNWSILEFADKNIKFLDKVIPHYQELLKVNGKVLTLSWVVGLLYAMKRIKGCDLETGMAFFDNVVIGEGLKDNYAPELFLRNWLIKSKIADLKPSKKMVLANVIMGWNYFRSDRPVTKMWSWTKNDEFPQLQ